MGAGKPLTESPRLRIGWIVACEAGGAAVIGLAFALEKWWRWTGVAPSTLVNVGTGFLLAGLLFLLERRFTTQVATQAKAVVQAVDERIEKGTRDLETRLDELQRRTAERVQRHGTRDDEAIGALDHVSFPVVAHALERANRMHALATSVARVQASTNPNGVWLNFAWGRKSPAPPGGSDPLLVLTAEFRGRGASAGWNGIEVQWLATHAPEEVGARLIDELRHAGEWGSEETLDWTLAIRNLRRTLRVAVDSKRRVAGAWLLRGPLIELVGDDWAVTDKGVEAPDLGYILRDSSFPRRGTGVEESGRSFGPENWTAPMRPAWAKAADWEYLISRGRELFGREPEPEPKQLAWRPELGGWED
jgi:hypothetical protein